MTTISNTYRFMELEPPHEKVLAYTLKRLGMDSMETVHEIAQRCHNSYYSNGQVTEEGKDLYSAIHEMFDAPMTEVRNLQKSTRSADTERWASECNVYRPTHIGRCAELFRVALVTVRDAFNSHHTGCARRGRPTDIDVDLSAELALAPIIESADVAATWNFAADTYQALKKRTDKVIRKYGLQTMPNVYERDDAGNLIGVTVTVRSPESPA